MERRVTRGQRPLSRVGRAPATEWLMGDEWRQGDGCRSKTSWNQTRPSGAAAKVVSGPAVRAGKSAAAGQSTTRLPGKTSCGRCFRWCGAAGRSCKGTECLVGRCGSWAMVRWWTLSFNDASGSYKVLCDVSLCRLGRGEMMGSSIPRPTRARYISTHGRQSPRGLSHGRPPELSN